MHFAWGKYVETGRSWIIANKLLKFWEWEIDFGSRVTLLYTLQDEILEHSITKFEKKKHKQK